MLLRRTAAHLPQVVAFEDVQDFQQRDPARRWWRRADHVISAIGALDRLPLFHLVLRQVVGSNQPSALLDSGRKFAGKRAMIEILRIFGDALQRVRKFGCLNTSPG